MLLSSVKISACRHRSRISDYAPGAVLKEEDTLRSSRHVGCWNGMDNLHRGQSRGQPGLERLLNHVADVPELGIDLERDELDPKHSTSK
jgi:hypothetical protein